MDTAFDRLTVSFPPLWEQRDEWVAVINAASGDERPFVELQAAYCSLMEPISTRPSSPSLVAWTILWTRGFQCVEGLRGATIRKSLFTHRILQRAAFETSLHLSAVARPFYSNASIQPELSRLAVRSRLDAYVAWCLWNDLKSYKAFLHPMNLHRIYNPKPARDFARQWDDVTSQLGSLVADLEVLTDAEAANDRKAAEKHAQNRINTIEELLEDFRLCDWVKSLTKRNPSSFLELLDEDQRSMLDALKTMGMRSGYSIYTEGSGVIHGSSLCEILSTSFPVVGPQIGADDEELLEHQNSALPWVRQCALWLSFLSTFVQDDVNET